MGHRARSSMGGEKPSLLATDEPLPSLGAGARQMASTLENAEGVGIHAGRAACYAMAAVFVRCTGKPEADADHMLGRCADGYYENNRELLTSIARLAQRTHEAFLSQDGEELHLCAQKITSAYEGEGEAALLFKYACGLRGVNWEALTPVEHFELDWKEFIEVLAVLPRAIAQTGEKRDAHTSLLRTMWFTSTVLASLSALMEHADSGTVDFDDLAIGDATASDDYDANVMVSLGDIFKALTGRILRNKDLEKDLGGLDTRTLASGLKTRFGLTLEKPIPEFIWNLASVFYGEDSNGEPLLDQDAMSGVGLCEWLRALSKTSKATSMTMAKLERQRRMVERSMRMLEAAKRGADAPQTGPHPTLQPTAGERAERFRYDSKIDPLEDQRFKTFSRC